MIVRAFSLFFLVFAVLPVSLKAQINEDILEDDFYTINRENLLQSGDTSYLNQWQTVDSLQYNDFLKTADSAVKEIFNQAWRDKNYPQVIKSYLYQLKYAKRKSEVNYLAQLKGIENTIHKLPAPHKHVLQSIAGSAWLDFKPTYDKDFAKKAKTKIDTTLPQFWDKGRIEQEAETYFLASISNHEELKALPIEKYAAVIDIPKQGERYQPTVFDALMWRAYRFYTRRFLIVTGQTYPPSLCFGDIETFISHDFRKDILLTGDLQKAIQILQRILRHNYNNQKVDAYVWGDIERVGLMRRFNGEGSSDSLTLLWFGSQIEKHKNHRVVVELYHKAAEKMACTSSYTNYRKSSYSYCNNALALKYCRAAIASFPNEWTTEKCRKLAYEITKVELKGQVEYSVLANKPFKYLVKYRNVSTLYVKFIAISSDSLRALKTKDYGKEGNKGILKELLKYPVVAEQQVQLPNDSTFFNNSTEWYYKGLPQGHYVILFSQKEDFSSQNNATGYSELWSTNYTIYSTHTGEDYYTYFVADAKNNKPVKGAKILFKYYDYKIKDRAKRYTTYKEGITDKNGTFSFKQEKSISLEAEVFIKGKRVIATNGSNYLHRYTGRRRSNIRTYYFTDRSIYRPGQTVYFKGVTINAEGGGLPIADRIEKVEFEDVNSEVVAKGVYKTNAFGSFSGSFIIPYGSINGNYAISSKSGNIYITVEEYKRPKFEVTINPYKGIASFGDTVTVTGKAVAFAGNALDGATLNYTVTLGGESYFFTERIGGEKSEGITVKKGELNLDSKGNFTISFLADSNKKHNINYEIEVIITDITGETHDAKTTVSIANRTVYAKIDAANEVFAQPKTEITVIGESINDEPIPVQGKLTINTLKVPEAIYSEQFWDEPISPIIDKKTHKKLFPYFALNGRDKKENYKIGEQIFSATVNDSTGSANLYWNTESVKSGLYLITYTYLDNLGDSQTFKKYIAVNNPKSKKAFPHKSLVLTAERFVYEPGIVAEVYLSSRFPKTRVLYYIGKQGKGGELRAVKLSNGIHKIEIPIEESDRGNIHITAFTVYNNRFYKEFLELKIPYTNKDLKVEVKSYRDKMLPNDKEEWELKISGKNAKKVSAEIVAAMYDASLDKIKGSFWYDFTNNYKTIYTNTVAPKNTTHTNHWLNGMYFYTRPKFEIKEQKLPRINFYNWIEDKLYQGNYEFFDGFGTLIGGGSFSGNGMGVGGFGKGGGGIGGSGGVGMALSARSKSSYGSRKYKDESEVLEADNERVPPPPSVSAPEIQNSFDLGAGFSNAAFIKVRRKLDETAFFYPHLVTNDSGYVIVKFVAPEALTKWKFRAFAHTKDLSSGFATINTLTQKPLMVQTNMPRFLREGDEIYISAKVVNLSGKELSPNAVLEIYDATTGRNIPEFNNINAVQIPQMASGVSQSVKWRFKVPEGYGALKIIIKAYDGNFTDAEANTLPILSNKVLITEAKPISFSGKKSKTYELEKLTKANQSSTLKHHKLTVEFTTNPAWYAIQALPYMMEYPYECAEQTFNRMYANMLGYYIANSSPKIKAVFDSWKVASAKGESDAFLSNLEKNQELKNLLLQETPWVAQGKTESERKLAMGKLFDENHMSTEISAARTKLFDMQKSSGAFPWFNGMGSNRTITQYIVAGVGRLNKITKTKNVSPEIKKALKYMGKMAQKDYKTYKKDKKPSFHIIQYLYALSFYDSYVIKDKTIRHNNFKWRGAAIKHWQKYNLMERAMLAIALNKILGGKEIANKIIKSFKETAIVDAEKGMYWKQKAGGLNWEDAPIETHCLILEAFIETTKDTATINQMRMWLLKQKQLNNWKTTKATANACYALLLGGEDWLNTENNISIKVGDKTIDPKTDEEIKTEAGTGYIKKSFSGSEVTPTMGKVTITPTNNANISMAWGGLYWQYFEKFENITYAQTPLSIVKQVFVLETTDSGKKLKPLTPERKLKAGTKLVVKILLNVSDAMEYVHLKDMRASALEPLETLSGHKWQNGVGYYRSIKDASMNYFFDKLPKGQWVFEYPLVVSQAGTFQNGIATIQSMYAPQYTSHTDGLVITVEP